MFARIKVSGPRKYLQIVENFREGNKVKQRVIVTVGRIDLLIKCLSRFADKVKVVDLINGGVTGGVVNKIGPDLTIKRFWHRKKKTAITVNPYKKLVPSMVTFFMIQPKKFRLPG